MDSDSPRKPTANAPQPWRASPRHAWLYALPDGQMPAAALCGDMRYEHVTTFKHDFFAATGLYRGPTGLAVLKLGRTTDFLGLRLDWIGKFLSRREIRLYTAAQGAAGVPRFIGPVNQTGFLHEYVPGHPLQRREPVSDTFFDELFSLVQALHERHIAYVDLNKRENILLGEDGRPHLIDFQISLLLPPVGWRRLRPVRWLLARFQHADRYHCLKHKRRLRPDLLTADEQRAVARISPYIRVHRWLFRPLIQVRRWILARLRRTDDVSVPGSSAK